MTPLEIRRIGSEGLSIAWSDGSETRFDSRALRTHCPCAECRAKRGDDSHIAPLTAKKRSLVVLDASAEEELELKSVWGVGNYAIGIEWGDGHTTGIYTFSFLQELGRSTALTTEKR